VGIRPPGFPPGGQFAVLSGDPRQGPFVVRFRAPAGYRIRVHTHPDDEHVTVLSGSFHVSMGVDAERAQQHRVKAGGYWEIPKGVPHTVWFSEDSTTQVHGSGPVSISSVNPPDDLRNERSIK
jgi:quercetin dioxygenase-like cupin family protein